MSGGISPTLRQPRLRIAHEGQTISSALTFEVHANAYLSGDTFSASFALGGDPNFGMSFWGNEPNPLLLQIDASLDGGLTFSTLILGIVDRIAADVDMGLIRVDGRDLTANFIDARADPSSFTNQTAAQVVQTLAGRHGMQADVTATTALVGAFDGMNKTLSSSVSLGSKTSSEWNLMCSLAQREQFDIWVKGQTIFFHPQPALTTEPFEVVFDRSLPFSNVIDLTAQRSLSFSKDITVIVKSYNSYQGRSFSAHAGTTNAPAGRTYTYVFPNLDAGGCQAAANRIRAQLSTHERLVAFQMPADLTLSPRDLVRVVGTGSSWDTLYKLDSITRSLSFEGGFVAHVQAKNFDPTSDAN